MKEINSGGRRKGTIRVQRTPANFDRFFGGLPEDLTVCRFADRTRQERMFGQYFPQSGFKSKNIERSLQFEHEEATHRIDRMVVDQHVLFKRG
jgi:hypothetical protein